jgi:hypothetical protein
VQTLGEIGSESQFSTSPSLGVRQDVSASAGAQQSANVHLLSSVSAGVKQIYSTRGDRDTGEDADKNIACDIFSDVQTQGARFGEAGSESQSSTIPSLVSSVSAGVKQIYSTRGDSDTGEDAEKKFTCIMFSDVQTQDASCVRIGSESQVFTISSEVLASVIRKLKKGKGSPDGITAEMFEALPEPALEKLTSFFNEALLGLIFRRVGHRRKPCSSLR